MWVSCDKTRNETRIAAPAQLYSALSPFHSSINTRVASEEVNNNNRMLLLRLLLLMINDSSFNARGEEVKNIPGSCFLSRPNKGQDEEAKKLIIKMSSCLQLAEQQRDPAKFNLG